MRKTGHTTNHTQKPTKLSDAEPILVRPSNNLAVVLIFKHKAHFSKIEDWWAQNSTKAIFNQIKHSKKKTVMRKTSYGPNRPKVIIFFFQNGNIPKESFHSKHHHPMSQCKVWHQWKSCQKTRYPISDNLWHEWLWYLRLKGGKDVNFFPNTNLSLQSFLALRENQIWQSHP